jgi:hypothetical protein
MSTLSTHRLHDQWEPVVHDFFRSAFHGQQYHTGEIRNILLKALDTCPTQSNACCIFEIQEYLKQCQVVGATVSQPSQQFKLQPSSIISIRGCPQLAVLQYLGKHVDISPASILSHLAPPNCFHIRAVKSQSHPFVPVQMISLGRCDLLHGRIGSTRAQLERYCEDYLPNMLLHSRPGTEQCRRVNLHGSTYFSVEQQVTFIPYATEKGSWSAIILNDSGEPSDLSPWHILERKKEPVPLRFLPMARLGSYTFGLPQTQNLNSLANMIKHEHVSPDPCQSRVSRDNKLLDLELCRQDPLAFLCDLLDTSALCWTRFLSFMEEPIEDPKSGPEERADILLSDKRVIDRASVYFSIVLELLD